MAGHAGRIIHCVLENDTQAALSDANLPSVRWPPANINPVSGRDRLPPAVWTGDAEQAVAIMDAKVFKHFKYQVRSNSAPPHPDEIHV